MQETEPTRPLRSASVMGIVLISLAVLALAAGIVTGLELLSRAASRADGLRAADIVRVALCFLAGSVVAAVLLTLHHFLRRQDRVIRNQLRTISLLESLQESHSMARLPAAPVPMTTAAPGDALTLHDMLDQLRELNRNVLLGEAQRQAKHAQLADATAEKLGVRIETLVGRGDFAMASAALDELVRTAPEHERVEMLRKQIAAARKTAEKQDIRDAAGTCRDLMALAQFEQAEKAARDLLAKHPGNSEAAELLQHVVHEAKRYTDEQRRRMYADIQKAATARQWRAALSAAQVFLDRHSRTPEADVVSAQLGTIRDNARIEEVRELRDRIRDLIGRKHFAEAVELADEVIRRFPETAAAEELRAQTDRLRERAREEGATK